MKVRQNAWLIALGLVLWQPHPVAAQSGWITVRPRSDAESLGGKAVMVSVIRDGTIAHQSEVTVRSSESFKLDPGVYDVRVEGDGIVTLVKRGITVTAGNTAEVIGGPLVVGEGAHIVEYATTGFTREELAERLTRLEAAMARVQKTLEKLVEALEESERSDSM
jgi:hypothetical protein